MRFYIHFHRYNDNDNNDDNIPKKEQFDQLTNRIEQLINKTKETISEQKVQRKNEELFRSMSDESNHNIVFWCIIHIIFLIGIGLCQIIYLKTYFIKKKII